jgi:hypothetical protein
MEQAAHNEGNKLAVGNSRTINESFETGESAPGGNQNATKTNIGSKN